MDSGRLAVNFPLETHGCSSIFYGIQEVSTGNQVVGPLRPQGGPGRWRRFLSEPRPQAVLLRIMKAFDPLAWARFSIQNPCFSLNCYSRGGAEMKIPAGQEVAGPGRKLLRSRQEAARQEAGRR